MPYTLLACTVALCTLTAPAPAQATPPPVVPAWAQPGSATHTQVAPPAEFHRASTTLQQPLGIFTAQTDVGSAVVPGSASLDAAIGTYTVRSAGYNIWYGRDEFRMLWQRVTDDDLSLAADISFPNPDGYGDRKAVLMVRASLDDDAPEAFIGLHGAGMIQLALRPTRGAPVTDLEYRINSRGMVAGPTTGGLATLTAQRIGLRKHGESFSLYVSVSGEPMHAFGPPIHLALPGPYYVGIGFCSHLPATVDSARFSNVMLMHGPAEPR